MTDTQPPDETTPVEPVPAPAAEPTPPAPAAFPQVLRTPWVNPAKRSQMTLIGVVAALLIAAVAFASGLAVGDDHGRDRDGGHVGPANGYYACMQNDTRQFCDVGPRIKMGPLKPKDRPKHPMQPVPSSSSPSK